MSTISNRRLADASHLLRYLYDRGIEASICGGFVRDALLERPFRDLDLYVSSGSFHSAKAALFGERAFDGETFEKGDEEYDHQTITDRCEQHVLPRLTQLWPSLNLETAEIDLIGVNSAPDAESVVSFFNLGINQVGLELLNGKPMAVKWTGNFVADKMDQSITILRTDWGREKTAAGIRKLNVKYPGWNVRYEDETPYDEAEFLKG